VVCPERGVSISSVKCTGEEVRIGKRESEINCGNCGASISHSDTVCRYCNTPVIKSYSLSEKESENLEAFIGAIEAKFKAIEGKSWIQGVVFILLAVLAVGSYFIYSRLFPAGIKAIILSAITGFILFIFFGYTLELTDGIAFRKLYRKEIKKTIHEYLDEMNYSRHLFDLTAHKVLPGDAILRKFLFK
jgi:hypothetical protein